MKYFTALLFLLLSVSLSAQFRMVGTSGGWTTVNDSTYSASITFQSDLTGKGYVATQIVDTFRLFTPTEQVYRVSATADLTFNTATLTVVEYGGTDGTPVGQVMVYNPDGNSTVPQIPFGSTGSTAQMQAAVDSYNVRFIGIANAADVTAAQLADTASVLRALISGIAPDQTINTTIIYCPAHGLDTADYVGKIIPLRSGCNLANSLATDSLQTRYVVGIPHADSLEIQISGIVSRPDNGLTEGDLYYLQDDGDNGASEGAVTSKTFVVLDTNYIHLIDPSSTGTGTTYIPYYNIPAAALSFYGTDTKAVNDTVIQNIAETLASAGVIVPTSILYSSNVPSVTRNAAYTQNADGSGVLFHAWYWNGVSVKRINTQPVAISARDTLYGGSGILPLDTVTYAGEYPTDSEIADWLEGNFNDNGLRLPNGSLVYWNDHTWVVMDDLSSSEADDWDSIVQKIKEPTIELDAANVTFTPASTITATDAQAAIVEALSDANAYTDANGVQTLSKPDTDSIAISGGNTILDRSLMQSIGVGNLTVNNQGNSLHFSNSGGFSVTDSREFTTGGSHTGLKFRGAIDAVGVSPQYFLIHNELLPDPFTDTISSATILYNNFLGTSTLTPVKELIGVTTVVNQQVLDDYYGFKNQYSIQSADNAYSIYLSDNTGITPTITNEYAIYSEVTAPSLFHDVIRYNAGVTPVDGSDLADKEYVDAAVSGGSGTTELADGVTILGDGTGGDPFRVDTTLIPTISALNDSLATVGSGDVVGPGSSTDNAIARFDGVTGKLIQNSGVTIDDSGNIELTNTTFASQGGIIEKNGNRFIHNFSYGNNGTATPTGRNIFIGELAGNLTLGSTALISTASSENIGIGYQVLNQLTTGYRNVAVGSFSGSSITTGAGNMAIGHSSGALNATGSNNTTIGITALYNNISGSNNVAFGRESGRYTSDGSTALTAVNNSVYIGANTKASANSVSDETVIGYNAIGNGSNTVTIGNSSVTDNFFTGELGIGVTPIVPLDVSGDAQIRGGTIGLDATSASKIETGSGSPESVVSASPGSTYHDTTNGILYVKQTGTGSTGWAPLSGDNIYNSNGTLTSGRTVTLNNNFIDFRGPGDVYVTDASLDVNLTTVDESVILLANNTNILLSYLDLASTTGAYFTLDSTGFEAAYVEGGSDDYFIRANNLGFSIARGFTDIIAIDSLATEIRLGTTILDADQMLGAGQDNYVLTYDNSTGLASWEAEAGGANIYNTNGTQDDATRTWNIDGNDLYVTNGGTIYLGADNATFQDYMSIDPSGINFNNNDAVNGTNSFLKTETAFSGGRPALQYYGNTATKGVEIWAELDATNTQEGVRMSVEESATASADKNLFWGDHYSNEGLWITEGDKGANISTHTTYFAVDIGNNDILVGKSDTDVVIQGTIWLDSGKTVGIFHGTGSPESVVTGAIGSTFHRTDGGAGTTLYVKESGAGNTGWVAK